MYTNNITISATGDSFITRRLPSYEIESYKRVARLMKDADVCFTNLEVTTHHVEGYPSATSGGTWAMAHPNVLQDLEAYGFNLYAWANNHTMDYSHGGLLATKKALDERNLVHAGAGRNMAEASSPKYLETAAGRVAIISATSTFNDTWRAGEQRRDMMGRPGVNPLRYETIYSVPKEEMQQLERIAKHTCINADHDLAIKEGFEVVKEDELTFGGHQFRVGDRMMKETRPLSTDMKRIEASIAEARRQADIVLFSIHSHEFAEEEKELPPQFLEIAARASIDAGADAVIGHGPHILRGIEIYRNKPIFYSLGNFIFQNETVASLPADFYEKYGLTNEANVADALDKRSNNNTKGLGANPLIWESVIAKWEMEEGKVKDIYLHPIELGFELPRYQRGWPKLSDKMEIIEELQRLSKPYGTKIEMEDGIGRIRLTP